MPIRTLRQFIQTGLLLACLAGPLAGIAAENAADLYQPVNLAVYAEANKTNPEMAQKKQRLIIQPVAIQFDATLMQAPKPGQFELVRDSLQFWQSDADMPEVDHSAYLQADNGQVIAVYVEKDAAKQLKQISETAEGNPAPLHVFAIHIYNYAQGPRLVVVAASTPE